MDYGSKRRPRQSSMCFSLGSRLPSATTGLFPAFNLFLCRWERASRFKLDPPEEVKTLILRLGGESSAANRCLWHDRI